MRTLGLWLLLLLVVLICTQDVDAKRRRRRRIRFRIRFTYKRRFGRSVEETMSLPCDFSRYDTNNDGYVNQLEVRDVISEFDPQLDSQENVETIFKTIDKNGDGLLQLEEFYLDPEYQTDCLLVKLVEDRRREVQNNSTTV